MFSFRSCTPPSVPGNICYTPPSLTPPFLPVTIFSVRIVSQCVVAYSVTMFQWVVVYYAMFQYVAYPGPVPMKQEEFEYDEKLEKWFIERVIPDFFGGYLSRWVDQRHQISAMNSSGWPSDGPSNFLSCIPRRFLIRTALYVLCGHGAQAMFQYVAGYWAIVFQYVVA